MATGYDTLPTPGSGAFGKTWTVTTTTYFTLDFSGVSAVGSHSGNSAGPRIIINIYEDDLGSETHVAQYVWYAYREGDTFSVYADDWNDGLQFDAEFKVHYYVDANSCSGSVKVTY